MNTKLLHSIPNLHDIAQRGYITVILSSSVHHSVSLTFFNILSNSPLSLHSQSETIKYQPLYFFLSVSAKSFESVKSSMSVLTVILFLLARKSIKLALALVLSSWIYNHFLKSKNALGLSANVCQVIVFKAISSGLDTLGFTFAFLYRARILLAAALLFHNKYCVAIFNTVPLSYSHLFKRAIMFLSQVAV